MRSRRVSDCLPSVWFLFSGPLGCTEAVPPMAGAALHPGQDDPGHVHPNLTVPGQFPQHQAVHVSMREDTGPSNEARFGTNAAVMAAVFPPRHWRTRAGTKGRHGVCLLNLRRDITQTFWRSGWGRGRTLQTLQFERLVDQKMTQQFCLTRTELSIPADVHVEQRRTPVCLIVLFLVSLSSSELLSSTFQESRSRFLPEEFCSSTAARVGQLLAHGPLRAKDTTRKRSSVMLITSWIQTQQIQESCLRWRHARLFLWIWAISEKTWPKCAQEPDLVYLLHLLSGWV